MRYLRLKQFIFKILYGETLYHKREKWTADKLREIPRGSKVLDACAGECRNKIFLQNTEYISQDFCQYGKADEGKICGYLTPSDTTDGEWKTSQIDIISDVLDIPVENESFDFVICTEAFEHIPSPEGAVKEFSRILKIGGALITTAPAYSGTHMAPYFFYNGLSEFWYRLNYEKYGFEIEELVKNGNAFDKIKEMCNDTNYYVKYYNEGKGLRFFEKVIMHMAGLICARYSGRTKNSENFITNEIMVVARKKKNVCKTDDYV